MQAGKHVLTEKPSASNAAEARTVRDAAVAAGVTLVEDFHYVHHPVAQTSARPGEVGRAGAGPAHRDALPRARQRRGRLRRLPAHATPAHRVVEVGASCRRRVSRAAVAGTHTVVWTNESSHWIEPSGRAQPRCARRRWSSSRPMAL
ncbi:oxidoreductase domain protein [Pseudonocardia sp. N23]|nr:oxidoreductase domain protein [Pseudonocardia sp. N23]